MADKQNESREFDVTQIGVSAEVAGTRIAESLRVMGEEKPKTARELDEAIGGTKLHGHKPVTVKIDVDVSDALTGLKAVQREAKKATQAMRELESAQVPDHVKNYGKSVSWTTNAESQAWFAKVPTKALAEELAKREGVSTVEIDTADIRSIELAVDLPRCGE